MSDRAARGRSTLAAGVGAFLALSILGGRSAWAHNSDEPPSAVVPRATPPGVTPDGDPAQAAAAMKAFGQMVSGPEPPQIGPASNRGLALMRRYQEAVNAPAALKFFAALGHDQSRDQFLTSLKTLPPGRRATVLNAFDKAYQAADARRQQKLLASMAEYYATRLTDEELSTVVAFYSTGMGYKMLHTGALTREEREQNGQYILEHPALLKFSRLNLSYMKRAEDEKGAMTTAFQADFRAELCRNLAEARLQSAGCLAGHG